MKLAIVAIDPGYSQIKAIGVIGERTAAAAYQRIMQPSIVGEAISLYEGGLDDEDQQVIVNGRRYFVGKLAMQSPVQHASLADDKVSAWTTGILLKWAIAKTIGSTPCNVVYCLPIDYYNVQRDAAVRAVMSINETPEITLIDGKREPRSVKLHLNAARVLPQGLSAFVGSALKQNGDIDESKSHVLSGSTLIVDPGHFTLGLLPCDGVKMRADACRSFPRRGMIAAYELLRQELMRKCGRAPEAHQTESVMLTGRYDSADVSECVQAALEQYAQSILTQVKSLNARFDKYVLVGGAANALQPYLEAKDMNTSVLGRMANAEGAIKLGAQIAWR